MLRIQAILQASAKEASQKRAEEGEEPMCMAGGGVEEGGTQANVKMVLCTLLAESLVCDPEMVNEKLQVYLTVNPGIGFCWGYGKYLHRSLKILVRLNE